MFIVQAIVRGNGLRVPVVRVCGRAEDDFYVLELQDNGLDLDLARGHGLFAMFRSYHTQVEASGIGLHTVKRMIENAGGQIEVHSQVGEGFVVKAATPDTAI